MRRNVSALSLIVLLASSLPLLAAAPERPDFSKSVREALEVLPIQPGNWEGDAWFRMGPVEPTTVRQVERIETRLDGIVLLIEGTGRTDDGTIVHHAFATLGWDPMSRQYRMTAWVADGTVTDAEVTFDDGVLTWGFQAPKGPHFRYAVTAPEKDVWEETGHISLDEGKTWHQFFGMTLHRTGE